MKIRTDFIAIVVVAMIGLPTQPVQLAGAAALSPEAHAQSGSVSSTLAQPGRTTQNAKIVTTKLADNLYLLYQNDFVNLVVLTGPDGVLIVDSGFDKNSFRGYVNSPAVLLEELKKLGNDKIRYIINTHTDVEHAFGNAELCRGATVIAHYLGRTNLEKNKDFDQAGQPNLLIGDSIRLYFNGEIINIFHMVGHTDHDLVVEFTRSKVVCTGDLLFPDSFGYISSGGDIHQMIKDMDVLHDRYSDDITFAAGHNRLYKRDYFPIYKDMLEKTLAIVSAQVDKGMGPGEMISANILKDWTAWNGKILKTLNVNGWIYNLYRNLSKKLSAAEKTNDLISEMGVDKARPYIREVLSQKDTYFFFEGDFNRFANILLYEKKIPEAIEMYRVVVEQLPTSAKAFYNLARAYAAGGNKDQAISNYRKSLELNPDNADAREQLKKLAGK